MRATVLFAIALTVPALSAGRVRLRADDASIKPDATGTTPLAWAVRQDDVQQVDKLIRAGADVTAANRYGITPLYLAALNGNAPIIEKLLKAGRRCELRPSPKVRPR